MRYEPYMQIMDNTQIYAIGFSGLFGIVALFSYLQDVYPRVLQLRNLAAILPAARHILVFISRCLTYRTFICRRKFVNRWSRSRALLLLIFCGLNIAALFVRFPGIYEVGARAGTLSRINMVLLYTGPHLSFVAGILGISLDTFHYLHSSVGMVSFILAAWYFGHKRRLFGAHQGIVEREHIHK